MKKALLVLLALLMLPVYGSAEEMRGYVKKEGYQYVLFGEYPYEKDGTKKPLLWRVLDVTDNQALLITEDVIDAQQVIFETDEKVIEKRTYRRIASYAESDLYTWMNTEALDTLLGDGPERNALVEEPGGGQFFILTSEQFLNTDYGFSAGMWNEQKSRQASATPYALKRGVYKDSGIGKCPYWAATLKEETGYKMQLIGYNGHLNWGAYTRVNVGLRPSVRLDMTQMEITGGTGTKKDPFILTYCGSPVPAETPAPVEPEATPVPAEKVPEVTATPVPVVTPAPQVEEEEEVHMVIITPLGGK